MSHQGLEAIKVNSQTQDHPGLRISDVVGRGLVDDIKVKESLGSLRKVT